MECRYFIALATSWEIRNAYKNEIHLGKICLKEKITRIEKNGRYLLSRKTIAFLVNDVMNAASLHERGHNAEIEILCTRSDEFDDIWTTTCFPVKK
jgi:hypothetical protein